MGQVAASAVLANITAEIQAIRHCICRPTLAKSKVFTRQKERLAKTGAKTT